MYVVGWFEGTASFGTTSLTSVGQTDVFVAKWEAVSHRFAWVRQAGGTREDEATAVAANGTSVYVTGTFNSITAGFGPTTLTNADTGGNSPDIFVTKLTDQGSTGAFVWAQRAGSGFGYDLARAVAVSGTSVCVAGYFFGTSSSFGSTVLTNANTTTLGGSPDGFVAKLTDAGSTGSFVWAQRVGGTNIDFVQAVAMSGSSVYLTGIFAGTATFGPTTLASVGLTDVFVSKLTDTGLASSFEWTQQAGGTGYDFANAVLTDGSSVYVAGGFEGPTASFGPTVLANAGPTGNDVFVTKLTDQGNTGSFAWAVGAGGTSYEVATALAVRGTSLYVAGIFSSTTANFGSAVLANSNTNESYDAFVARLTDVGPVPQFVWAQQAGGLSDDDGAASLALSGTSVCVGGYVSTPASFGMLTVSSSAGGTVGFLASLTDPTLTATTAALRPESITLSPNPARATTTVHLPAGPATLTLLDILGRTLHTQTAPANSKIELDLSGLAPGLYAVRVAAGGSAATRRLVVE